MVLEDYQVRFFIGLNLTHTQCLTPTYEKPCYLKLLKIQWRALSPGRATDVYLQYQQKALSLEGPICILLSPSPHVSKNLINLIKEFAGLLLISVLVIVGLKIEKFLMVLLKLMKVTIMQEVFTCTNNHLEHHLSI